MSKPFEKRRRTGRLNNPTRERPGEKIGGGAIVMRRGRRTNRVRPGDWPYEHPDRQSAIDHALELAEKHTDAVYEVWVSLGDVRDYS